jgi:hypothetical protein
MDSTVESASIDVPLFSIFNKDVPPMLASASLSSRLASHEPPLERETRDPFDRILRMIALRDLKFPENNGRKVGRQQPIRATETSTID